MTMPRFIIVLLNKIGVIRSFDNFRCDACGQMIGSFKSMKEAEAAFDAHVDAFHPDISKPDAEASFGKETGKK